MKTYCRNFSGLSCSLRKTTGPNNWQLA